MSTPNVNPVRSTEQLYERAVQRLHAELGWTADEADAALADCAAANGVFVEDIAAAVVAARSLKRGLSGVLRNAALDRRPLALRTTTIEPRQHH